MVPGGETGEPSTSMTGAFLELALSEVWIPRNNRTVLRIGEGYQSADDCVPVVCVRP